MSNYKVGNSTITAGIKKDSLIMYAETELEQDGAYILMESAGATMDMTQVSKFMDDVDSIIHGTSATPAVWTTVDGYEALEVLSNDYGYTIVFDTSTTGARLTLGSLNNDDMKRFVNFISQVDNDYGMHNN